MGINELTGFLNSIKQEYQKLTPRLDAYQKIFKELKQEERRLLLNIIRHPNAEVTPAKVSLASRIKDLETQIQEKTFQSRRSTGILKSIRRSIKNIFNDRISTDKIIREIIKSPDFVIKTPRKAPDPIRYKKGEKKTQEVIPRNKQKVLGEGAVSKVYEHKTDPTKAVKKIPSTLISEYLIGATLRHTNLAKTYQLYTKEYPGELITRTRFDMEKIEGKTIYEYRKNHIISRDQAVKLLSQAKDCCGYLFDQDVAWQDINSGNILIENNTGDLKLIDFGCWIKAQDPMEKGLKLLTSAQELSVRIILSTQLKNSTNSFLYPVKFSEENFLKKTKNMNDEELKKFVLSYFDYVIAQLEKRL